MDCCQGLRNGKEHHHRFRHEGEFCDRTREYFALEGISELLDTDFVPSSYFVAFEYVTVTV